MVLPITHFNSSHTKYSYKLPSGSNLTDKNFQNRLIGRNDRGSNPVLYLCA